MDGAAFKMEDADVRGGAWAETDLVVGGGAERVVARLQPFETGEGEPAIGFGEIGDVLSAPGEESLLPFAVLCGGSRRYGEGR